MLYNTKPQLQKLTQKKAIFVCIVLQSQETIFRLYPGIQVFLSLTVCVGFTFHKIPGKGSYTVINLYPIIFSKGHYCF